MNTIPLLPAADFWSETFPVADAFQERIRDSGLGTIQITLIAFLVTFLITRAITHMIKAGKGPFGDISVGGTHLHHLVPGIFLLLISGVIGIAIDWQPGRPASLIVPVLFGIGAALTLDEFALWLTLRDVYWSKEGRRSVDAVIVLATVLTIAALEGASAHYRAGASGRRCCLAPARAVRQARCGPRTADRATAPRPRSRARSRLRAWRLPAPRRGSASPRAIGERSRRPAASWPGRLRRAAPGHQPRG